MVFSRSIWTFSSFTSKFGSSSSDGRRCWKCHWGKSLKQLSRNACLRMSIPLHTFRSCCLDWKLLPELWVDLPWTAHSAPCFSLTNIIPIINLCDREGAKCLGLAIDSFQNLSKQWVLPCGHKMRYQRLTSYFCCDTQTPLYHLESLESSQWNKRLGFHQF